MAAVTGYSFDAQLAHLRGLVVVAKQTGHPFDLMMALSITESVKQARDHALNCCPKHLQERDKNA
jgi:hypothetical protein